MGFNLKGFAGGLADGATDFYKAQNDTRDERKKDTRHLIFQAHEQVYKDAKEAQKENKAQVTLDSQYSSIIRSMDPTISDDNLTKLLSLDKIKREQAESELLYRQIKDPSATFSSFMSYVNEPEDLDDMEELNNKAENSLIAAPNPAEPYYDKSGLVRNATVDTMYAKVVGVLTDAHGFSPEKAREITKQATQELEYPPIKINWSEQAFLKQEEIERIVEENAHLIVRKNESIASLTNRHIQAAIYATDGAIDVFASNYMRQAENKDGDLLWLDDGKTVPKMGKMGPMDAKLDPEFTTNFRKSKAYTDLAVESSSSYIKDMVTNPKKRPNSMNYLNGAFPGMYKGEIDVATEEGIKAANAVDPFKIYFLKANPNNTSTPDGGVYTGAQIIQGLINMGLRTGVTAATDNGGSDETDTTIKKTDKVVAAENKVVSAEEAIAFAKEIGDTEGSIASLQVVLDEANEVLLDTEAKAASSASLDEQFKNWEFSVKPTADQHGPTSVRLKAAIKAGDPIAIEMELANLDKLSESQDLSFQMQKKVGSLRGDALRKLKAIDREVNPTTDQLMQRLENFIQERPRSDTMSSISGGLMGSKLKKEEIKGWIKQLNSATVPTRKYELERYNRLKVSLYELLQGN